MLAFRSGAFGTLAAEAENTDGKVAKEIEHMFYARVQSPETLLKASSCEIQEQWGLWQDKTEKNAGMGSNRIRKTITKPIVNGQFDNENTTTEYVLTTKLKTPDGAALEISIAATADGHKAFRVLAESGMIKHRYHFPVAETDLVWEVDMFVKPGEDMMSTVYLPWAKIDLEVPSMDFPLPPFPEGFLDLFDSKVKEPTAEQSAVIEEMQNYLSLPNPHVKEVYKGVL
jgi:hypothetical protein